MSLRPEPPVPSVGAATVLADLRRRNAPQSRGEGERLILGRTTQGRELCAYLLGNPHARRRVVLVAGQHGDEPVAVEAARETMRRFRSWSYHAGLGLWVIPCLNPDGAGAGRRTNATGIDLNRDHLNRAAVETRLLHRFLSHVRPGLVLDLHAFPSRRRWMKPLGIRHASDVMIDWPSGPAAWTSGAGTAWGEEWLGACQEACGGDGLIASRYWLRSSRGGRIRHSTANWLDLRNHAAAIYGCRSVLVEGQHPHRGDEEQRCRTVEAMARGVMSILGRDWPALPDPRPTDGEPACERSVPLHFRRADGGIFRADVRRRRDRALQTLVIPGRYRVERGPAQWVRVPAELLIPAYLSDVVGHLRRLGAPLYTMPPDGGADPGAGVGKWQAADRCGEFWSLADDPRRQAVWALLLHPRVRYGLARSYPQSLRFDCGGDYPILARRSPEFDDVPVPLTLAMETIDE